MSSRSSRRPANELRPNRRWDGIAAPPSWGRANRRAEHGNRERGDFAVVALDGHLDLNFTLRRQKRRRMFSDKSIRSAARLNTVRRSRRLSCRNHIPEAAEAQASPRGPAYPSKRSFVPMSSALSSGTWQGRGCLAWRSSSRSRPPIITLVGLRFVLLCTRPGEAVHWVTLKGPTESLGKQRSCRPPIEAATRP